MQSKNNRYLWLWIIPIILIMTWIAVPWLHRDIIWFDEYRSLERAGGGRFMPISFVESMRRILPSIWPPFYFVLLWVWDNLTQSSTEFVGRAFQYLTGAVAISLIYRTASDIFNRRVGIFAATLLATNVMFLFYVHELRPYVMWVALITACIWLYWRIYTRNEVSQLSYWSFTLVIAATLYTHHLSPIFVGLLGIFHLLSWKTLERQRWNKILWQLVLAAAIYAPGLAILSIYIVRESENVRPVDRIELLTFASVIFTNGLSVGVTFLLLYSFRWIQSNALRFIWFVGAVTIVMMVILDIPVKFLFHPRYLMAGLPSLVLVMAFALDRIWTRLPIVSVGFLLFWVVAGSIYNENELVSNVPEDSTMNNSADAMLISTMSQIEYAIDMCSTENDFIAFATNTAIEDDVWFNPLAYYLLTSRDYAINFGLVGNLLDVVPNRIINVDEIVMSSTADERIETMLEGHDNIWIMHDPTIHIYDELQLFTNGLQARGYVNCGAVIEQPELIGTVWTQQAEQCQQIIASCNVPTNP